MAGKLLGKRNRKYTQTPPGANRYYLEIAAHLGRAKWITIFLLILTLLACVIFARNELSLYNFRYLMKHFDVNSADNASNFSTLRYDSDASYSFGYYKDDLVIASSTGIDFYDMRENSVLSKTHSMSTARIVCTDNYLYVYDQGNYSYSVYDSFFNIKNEVLDYPISMIAASDSGVFAVAAKNLEYRSAVYVYDKNFRTLSEIYKDKLVLDIDISDDGSRVLIVSCETDENGEFFTEIQSLEPGKSEAEFTLTVHDCYPVSGAYFSNGNIGLVASDRILFYDKKGVLLAEESFSLGTPTACGFSDDYTVVAFNQSVIGTKSMLMLYGTSGEELGKLPIEGQVKKLQCEKAYLYALLTDSVARIEKGSGEILYEYTESNPLDFIIRDEHSLLLCYGNRTQAVNYAFTGMNIEGEME